MLLHAFGVLRELATKTRLQPVVPVRGDFTEVLPLLGRHPRTRQYLVGRRLLFILGATVGNFREVRLLKHVLRFMRGGDFLVLGAEFHKLVTGQTQDLSRALAWFNSAPYLAYWKDRGTSPHDAFPKASFISQHEGRSQIVGALTIETRVKNVPEPLFTSAYYDEAALIQFIRRLGFVHRFSEASPQSAFYKLVVLEKPKKRSA